MPFSFSFQEESILFLKKESFQPNIWQKRIIRPIWKKQNEDSDENSKTIQCYFVFVWIEVGFRIYSSVGVLHIYRGADKGGKYWKHIGKIKCRL